MAEEKLHWVFKTASGGTEGALVIRQNAFDALADAMMVLKAEKHELTLMQGPTVTAVPVVLKLPLAEGVLLQFPTKKARERKKNEKPPKPSSKSNGKSNGHGASPSKRPPSNRTRTRTA